jgi:hypothetical protein
VICPCCSFKFSDESTVRRNLSMMGKALPPAKREGHVGSFGGPHDSLPQALQPLREKTRLLHNLLADPHPGLSTWCIAFAETLSLVIQIGQDLSGEPGTANATDTPAESSTGGKT